MNLSNQVEEGVRIICMWIIKNVLIIIHDDNKHIRLCVESNQIWFFFYDFEKRFLYNIFEITSTVFFCYLHICVT